MKINTSILSAVLSLGLITNADANPIYDLNGIRIQENYNLGQCREKLDNYNHLDVSNWYDDGNLVNSSGNTIPTYYFIIRNNQTKVYTAFHFRKADNELITTEQDDHGIVKFSSYKEAVTILTYFCMTSH